MVGPAQFTVKDVKLGSRISNLHLVLSQEQPNGQRQEEVVGYITMSNIASESGISIDTSYKPYPPRLPVDLGALARNGQDENWSVRSADPFAHFRRAAQNLQMFLVKPSRRPANMPKSVGDQWVRFAPGRQPTGRWTNDALGFLVDMFPQLIEQYVNPVAEEAALGSSKIDEAEVKKAMSEPRAKYWYPTLSLNLDAKKLLPDEGVEWLFVRVKAKAIRNGRFDLDVEVWDEQDELVAISSHASLAVDSARNTTRNAKKDSKI